MSAARPGRDCPVDLHYPEPRPPALDVGAIVGRGRRIRRRRTLARAGAVLAGCVAAASVITGTRGFTLSVLAGQPGPPAAAGAAPIDAQVAQDPPASGKLTLIGSWPRHWTTVAWATRRGEVCWATFRTPMQGGTEEVQCPAWEGSQVPGSSRALSGLDPGIAPDVPPVAGRDLFPVLGLTSPQAARVTLTAFGLHDSARVVQVPLRAGRTVGVFLAWIQAPASAGGYSSTDITSETAYDTAGRIIARTLSPP